jgi:hypothetical protein
LLCALSAPCEIESAPVGARVKSETVSLAIETPAVIAVHAPILGASVALNVSPSAVRALIANGGGGFVDE